LKTMQSNFPTGPVAYLKPAKGVRQVGLRDYA